MSTEPITSVSSACLCGGVKYEDAADCYSIHDGLPQYDDHARVNMTYFEE